jgi:hypothetical protein
VDRTDRSFVLTARYVLRNCICENDEAGAKISTILLLTDGHVVGEFGRWW